MTINLQVNWIMIPFHSKHAVVQELIHVSLNKLKHKTQNGKFQYSKVFFIQFTIWNLNMGFQSWKIDKCLGKNLLWQINKTCSKEKKKQMGEKKEVLILDWFSKFTSSSEGVSTWRWYWREGCVSCPYLLYVVYEPKEWKGSTCRWRRQI